jgi:hypothetical protein
MPRLLSPPGKDPVPIVQEAGWAPGPVWTGVENLAPHQDSIPRPSSPQPVAIPTELPGPLVINFTEKTNKDMQLRNSVLGKQMHEHRGQHIRI